VIGLLLGCAPAPPLRTVDLPTHEQAPVRAILAVGFDPPGAPSIAEGTAAQVLARLSEIAAPPWEGRLLTGGAASEGAIRAALSDLIPVGHHPHADDRLVLWLIAHGDHVRGVADEPAAVLSSEGGGAPVAVPFARLLAALEESPIGRIVLVADACYGGARPAGGGLTTGATGRALLLAATDASSPAFADVGEGGRYSRCLLEALEDGAAGLLDAHTRTPDCLRALDPRAVQVPRALPGRWPFEVEVGLRPSPPILLAVGGAPRVDDAPLEPAALGAWPLPSRSDQVRIGSGEESWSRQIGPGTTLLWRQGPGGPELSGGGQPPRLVLQEQAEPLGLAGLLATGKPSAAVVVDLGVGTSLLVTRRQASPILVAGGPAGLTDRSVELGLSALPPDLGICPPAVLDLDQDGRPEVCYGGPEGLVCAGHQGAVPFPGPRQDACFSLQRDVDGDGDLDLIGRVGAEAMVLVRERDAYLPGRPPGRAGHPLARLDTVEVLALQAPLLLGAYDNVPLLFQGGPSWIELMPPITSLPVAGYVWARDVLETPGVDLVQWDAAGWGGLSVRPAVSGWPPWGPPRAVPGVLSGEVHGVLAEDLDGDGLSDLVIVEREAHRPAHHLLLRRPIQPAGWVAPAPPAEWGWRTDDQQIVPWDFDGDGDLDLVMLNGGEQQGRSRLFVNGTPRGGGRLVVDVGPEVGAFIGARLRIRAAGVSREVVLDGSRREAAAVVALGSAMVPDHVHVRWPDGWAEEVQAVERDGVARVVLGQPRSDRPVLLADAWEIDLGVRRPVPRRILPPGRPSTGAVRVGELLAVNGDPGQLWWVQRDGQVAAAVAVPGCGWISADQPRGRAVLSCQQGDEGLLAVVRPGDPIPSWLRPPGVAGFGRAFVSDGARAWLASGRRWVSAVEPETLQPLGAPLAAADGLDRDWLWLADPTTLLVLDLTGGRVEVWDVRREPGVLRGRLEGLDPSGVPPAWDTQRGWWWIPTWAGLVAVDPQQLGGPARELPLADPVVAALALGQDEIALLVQRPAGVTLVVQDHSRRAEVGRPVVLPRWEGGRAMAVLRP
jgi:hypothetical protein